MQPPQNPYGSPNPYESGQPGYSPAPASRGVSMDVIGEAWKFVQPNIGPWIGAILVLGVISLVLNLLTQRLGMSVTPVPLPEGVPSTMPDGSPIPGLPSSTGIPTPNALYFVFMLISFVVNQFLAGGLMRMAIDQTRTGKVDFGKLFSAGDVIVNLLIAGILTTIATAIGFLLCVIPGLILSALFALVTPLIVDKGRGGVDALSESLNLLKPHLGAMLVLLIVLVLINIAGAIPCLLGLFVTIPITLTAIALVYRDLTGGVSAPPSTGFGGPSAPIASPQ